MADEVSEQFGIRTIETGPDFGLKLNGKKVLLKGYANHHTLGALGAAAYPRAIEKRIQLMKQFGINHIRTSHNPYSRDFIKLCDKYGILVVDELYDKWTQQHTGGRAPFMAHWAYDVTEWVKRDRNSPSVVLWSLGNELQQNADQPFNDFGLTCYKMMKTVLQRYDSTRLGRKANPKDAQHRNQIRWEGIVYQKGKLEAVGYMNNKVVTRHALETTGKPVRIMAEPDNSHWKADGLDLQHVRLTVVDQKGRRVRTYNDELTFEVEGDAKIVAVTNGDINSNEMNTGKHCRLWQGSAMVILRAGTTPSQILLKTSPATFKTMTTKLETK